GRQGAVPSRPRAPASRAAARARRAPARGRSRGRSPRTWPLPSGSTPRPWSSGRARRTPPAAGRRRSAPPRRRPSSPPSAESPPSPSGAGSGVRSGAPVRSQQILPLELVLAALVRQPAGVEAEAVDADWRRAQQVVIGDPRRDAVGRGLRLQIGQGDVRPVLAALPGQAGALPRGAAAAGEDREPFAGLHPGPDRVG